MRKAEFRLEPLTCPSCIKKIENKLGKMKGIKEPRVLFNSSKVKVDFDETEIKAKEIKETIEKLGYPVLSKKIA